MIETAERSRVLRTEILNQISDIPSQDWERLYPQTLENYFFFKTLDESGLDQFQFYYITVYAGKDLAGIAPCFLMRYSLDTTVQGPIKTLALKLKKIFPHFLELKALMCGLPMGQGRIGWGEEEPAKMLEAICRALESLAASQGVSILAFKDFSKEDCQRLDALQSQGYYKFESLPLTEMKVPFLSFEEYLKTLSRASRDGLKRKFKKTDKETGLEMEIKTGLDTGEIDQIYDLYLQTVTHHTEISFEIMPRTFFQRVSENMTEETRYFLWRLRGRVIAFALCLVNGERMIDYYLGFDYSLAYDSHLYFIRFRDLLNWCIQNKISTYEMGNTSYEPKRRLGFEFVQLFAYAKCRHQAVNPFFHLLCKLLKPENFDEVFKIMRKNEQAVPHA